ncbi:phosphatidylinositol N-acetylglucosaminyltransferase subunit Y-like [Lolium rigidum]|uniref:phosphatidylinositol N-acetylglucosaminyltransferase subunit Y-like n=1 Tax=Lolium rigidum TaxID=89674 RepID=UPI001F5DD688|nr:phosphatidylinositol N-acetylglucosaminyltransferase subunit Y-like [Lolium rigidum]
MALAANRAMGFALVAVGITLLAGFLYAAVLSKALPPPDNWFLLAIRNDRYYCLLVPLTVPVIIVAVYLHWMSMKMFKHA